MVFENNADRLVVHGAFTRWSELKWAEFNKSNGLSSIESNTGIDLIVDASGVTNGLYIKSKREIQLYTDTGCIVIDIEELANEWRKCPDLV